MNLKSENIITLILISLSIIIYFVGFYFREISNGAAHTDFQLHIWPLINDFEKDYSGTLKNYLNYKEATFPFYHSIQSILNPFKSNYASFNFSNTIINLLILFIFYYFLKKKISFNNSNLSIIIIPFIFLLSPWFRSTSFWSTTENFALFLTKIDIFPACYYLFLLIKDQDNYKTNFLLTLFISLAIYSRQQFLFLALTHISILIISGDYKKLLNTLIYYFFLSLPGIYTYYIWGVFSDLNNATSASDYISLQNIFVNIPKISTLIFFYLAPIFLINIKTIKKILNFKEFVIYFVLIIFIEYILFKNINYGKFGGGYIIKFNQIFFNNSIYLIILISSIFFSTIICLRKLINYRYYLLLLFIFIVIGLPKYLYQEWFDPIYLIFYYMLIPEEKLVFLNLNKTKSVYFLYIWELIILFIAIIYYHLYLKLPIFYSF